MIDGEKNSAKDQKEYQSGLGMLLFLVKHSKSDIANVTSKLSKTNDDVSSAKF